MEFERLASRETEQCRGVIKKLFPTKRYGFAICECAEHRGEAHFNYSELALDEASRNALCVGWRLEFEVSKQDRPTDHCEYRASSVRPVKVMVVQCELVDVSGDYGQLISRELGGKRFMIRRENFNGKFEIVEGQRRSSCRAAITFEDLKRTQAYALHCSQDTPPGQRTVSPSRRQDQFGQDRWKGCRSVDLGDDEDSLSDSFQTPNRDNHVVPFHRTPKSVSGIDKDSFKADRYGTSDPFTLRSFGCSTPLGGKFAPIGDSLTNKLNFSSRTYTRNNSTSSSSTMSSHFGALSDSDSCLSPGLGNRSEKQSLDFGTRVWRSQEKLPSFPDFGGYGVFNDAEASPLRRSNSFSPGESTDTYLSQCLF